MKRKRKETIAKKLSEIYLKSTYAGKTRLLVVLSLVEESEGEALDQLGGLDEKFMYDEIGYSKYIKELSKIWASVMGYSLKEIWG